MKLWEVIKALTEDPTKKFELTQHGRTETLTIGHGYLNYSRHAGHKLEDDVYVNDNNWQHVRQPVTWQEAMQAWADGKDIRLVMPEWEQVWKPTDSVEISCRQFVLGKWYVE